MGDFVRNHALPEEQPTICGSLNDPRNKPTWADEVVRNDDLLGLKKALLTSDVIIYDVSTSPKDATSALKVMPAWLLLYGIVVPPRAQRIP